MATRWLETDSLSNQNISSPLAVGAYTADADRWIAAQVFADQVAGNGDYYLYLTLQINGAGSSYKSGITTLTAASGVTAIFGQTVYIFVRSGDIVTAYLDGLAGDTTTPDTIVRWAELDALRPTTADRTLDVSATGEAGLDFDNIKQATGATTLTNITVPVVSAVTGLTASNLDATVSSRLASASYTAPLTAATTRTALGMAAADLDSQLDAILAASGAGGGTSYQILVNDGTNPLDGVFCWVTTDAPGVNTIASGYTNASGLLTFQLDAGSYYLWRQLAGYNFTNPTSFTVS